MMDDPAFWHRLQFAFTITYHYLFPQLTMGLAWFLVFWKWRALRTGDERYAAAARFWAQDFGLNFALGVVTGHSHGVPVRHELGGLLAICRWRHWPDARHGRHVRVSARKRFHRSARVGREAARPEETLSRCRRRRRRKLAVGLLHPRDECLHAAPGRARRCRRRNARDRRHLGVSPQRVGARCSSRTTRRQRSSPGPSWSPPWARSTRCAACTANRRACTCATGRVAGLVAAILVAFPTGDAQAKIVARYQEPALAAMEGRFETGPMAEHHADRTAQRQGASPRQPDQDSGHAQFPGLRHLSQRRTRPGRVSRGRRGPRTSSCSTTRSMSWPASERSSSP